MAYLQLRVSECISSGPTRFRPHHGIAESMQVNREDVRERKRSAQAFMAEGVRMEAPRARTSALADWPGLRQPSPAGARRHPGPYSMNYVCENSPVQGGWLRYFTDTSLQGR